MIPFPVVVGYERRERSAQVGFPKDDDPIQAFLLDRPDKSLRVCIAVGRLKRRLHDPDADIGQGLAERCAPFGISIADQDPVAPEDTVIRAGQHTSDLEHEGVIRMRRRSHQMHASRLQLDDKERVVRDQSADGPQLGGEEIRRGDRAPVGGQNVRDIGRSGTGPIP
jgi:hypothetical protein